MKFFLTCPSLAPHGGIRVILEWANNLVRLGHEALVRTDDRGGCAWFRLDPRVAVVFDDRHLVTSDCLVVCSPHGAHYLEHPGAPARRFAFMQMAEHLFRPDDSAWQAQCRRFYLTPWPLLGISRWNLDLVATWGRTAPTHYVGNGVNLQHFPISTKPKDGKTVLVEGWWPTNPTKDHDRVAARVAKRLRAEGYRILAYGLKRSGKDSYAAVPHEYLVRPTLPLLNRLYERATILIKATRCDARSCAPVEAMTKGTVTARAIEQGDDDLVHGENALRCSYDFEALYLTTKALLTQHDLRDRLAANGRAYVQANTWDAHFARIEPLLTVGAEASCTA